MRRREFLIRSTAAGCVSLGGSVPGIWRCGASTTNSSGRTLVVLGLVGGNDGLNTVIPFEQDEYHRRRPSLAIAKKQVVKLDDSHGLHPRMAPLRKLYDVGRLAVVQGVGYPHSDRSHFRATEIWHTARPTEATAHQGWLAGKDDSGKTTAASVGEETSPLALAGPGSFAPDFASIEGRRLRLDGVPDGERALRGALLEKLSASTPGLLETSDLDFIRRATAAAYGQSRRMERLEGRRSKGNYPDSKLGAKLKTAAELIEADLGLEVVFLTTGSFDTHAQQQMVHADLLGELAEGIAAFEEDLAARGLGDRVLVVTYSEFGRRVQENGGLGTDHGSAGPMLLFGPLRRAGLIGIHPSLTDLDDGDLKFHIDFRSVYATLLQRWLGRSADAVLAGRFSLLDFL